MRITLLLVILSGCHLLESGEIKRTCEDLAAGCLEDNGGELDSADTGPLDQDLDGDGFTGSEDCDDTDGSIYPGAEESCDGIDSDCDGAEDSGIITVDAVNQPNIQAAIDAAAEGSTVHICGGVWDEDLTISQSIHLLGQSTLDHPVVNGQGTSSTIHITGGEVEITGLDIQGGTGLSWSYMDTQDYLVGGGVAVEFGSLILSDSIVSSNSAELGGGVFASDEAGPLEIRKSTIGPNIASEVAGGVFTMIPLSLIQTTVTTNQAPFVGGVYAAEVDVLLDDSHIVSNLATVGYGGILLSAGDLTCQSSASIQQNDGSDYGGGLTLQEGSATGCLVTDNEAQVGAGVYLSYAGSTTLTSLVIRDNDSSSQGGGIYAYQSDLIMEACTVEGNQAPNGAGLYIENDDEEVLISGGSFISNTARNFGGGIYYKSGYLQVISVDFGTDDQANSPDDVVVPGVFSGEESHTGLGPSTSFTCEDLLGVYSCDL